MEEERDIPVVPAPWTLTGMCYVLLSWFPRDFVMEHGFIPDDMKGSFRGGPGWVMYVDYSSSDAGPYQELLFIPGRFDFSGRRCFSVTKIYVSTMASVVGGKANWGIPKELAFFERRDEGGRCERIRVSREGTNFAEFLFHGYPLSLPATASLMPRSWRTLGQNWEGKTLFTTLKAGGTVSPARLIESHIDPDYFPPISKGRLTCTVRMPHFVTVFPKAQTA